jgi:hypothetical protein
LVRPAALSSALDQFQVRPKINLLCIPDDFASIYSITQNRIVEKSLEIAPSFQRIAATPIAFHTRCRQQNVRDETILLTAANDTPDLKNGNWK